MNKETLLLIKDHIPALEQVITETLTGVAIEFGVIACLIIVWWHLCDYLKHIALEEKDDSENNS